MVDYGALYHKMIQETEKAIQILIQAQQACEEQYLETAEDAPSEDTPAAASSQ